MHSYLKDNKMQYASRGVKSNRSFSVSTLLCSKFLCSLLLASLSLLQPRPGLAQNLEIAGLDFELPEMDYYVADVVVAQREQIVAGFTISTKAYIKMGNTLEAELKSYFTKRFPQQGQKKPLILKVNKLLMLSDNTFSNTQLSLSFISLEAGQYVQLLQTAAAAQRNWIVAGATLPQKFGANMLSAFRSCFEDFQRRERLQQLTAVSVTEASLRTISVVRAQWALSHGEGQGKGFFRTYGDFVDHLVDSSMQFKRFDKWDTYSTRIPFDNYDLAGERFEFWGYTDGIRYYYRWGESLVPMYFNEEDNSISIYIQGSELRSNAEAFIIPAGLVGFLVAKAVEAANSVPEELRLDVQTGEPLIGRGKLEVVLDNRSKKAAGEICIYELDQPLACLKTNEFYRYKYDPGEGVVRLTLKTAERSREICFYPVQEQLLTLQHEKHVKVTFQPPVKPEWLAKQLDGRTEVFGVAPQD
jgi:hypothetical protein